jgi:hypothetical protein
MYWRAGLAAFVAAAECAVCGCQVRANNAFSIRPEAAPKPRLIG